MVDAEYRLYDGEIVKTTRKELIKKRSEELGLTLVDFDDPNYYKCSRCGTCCLAALDTPIKLFDLYRLLEYKVQSQGIAQEAAKDQLREELVANETGLYINYDLDPYGTKCPYFKEGAGCVINDAKPTVCATYPYGYATQCLCEDGLLSTLEKFTENSMVYIVDRTPEYFCNIRQDTQNGTVNGFVEKGLTVPNELQKWNSFLMSEFLDYVVNTMYCISYIVDCQYVSAPDERDVIVRVTEAVSGFYRSLIDDMDVNVPYEENVARIINKIIRNTVKLEDELKEEYPDSYFLYNAFYEENIRQWRQEIEKD